MTSSQSVPQPPGPFAEVEDVEVEVGALTTEDRRTAEVKLDQAAGRVRQVFPDIEDRLLDGRTTLTLVRQVEAEMVAAFFRNRDGAANQQTYQTVGPFSMQKSQTFGPSASGLIDLTPRQRNLLGGGGDRKTGSFAPALAVPPAAAYLRPAAGWDGQPSGWS